jgi:putative Mn2+ efflux pump MntP
MPDFGYYTQLGIAVIFFGLALKCVQESLDIEKKKIEWGVVPVIILAFATSIDALASGVSLATVPRAYFAATEVGLITFSICACFYFISKFFRQIPDRWLLRMAALIFLFLGGEVLWSIRSLFLRG